MGHTLQCPSGQPDLLGRVETTASEKRSSLLRQSGKLSLGRFSADLDSFAGKYYCPVRATQSNSRELLLREKAQYG